jgi:hypothetical protein
VVHKAAAAAGWRRCLQTRSNCASAVRVRHDPTAGIPYPGPARNGCLLDVAAVGRRFGKMMWEMAVPVDLARAVDEAIAVVGLVRGLPMVANMDLRLNEGSCCYVGH